MPPNSISASAITTGDFDLVTACEAAFEAALVDLGFEKPLGPGHTPLGWAHPQLKLGFEIVSTTLLDGLADASRIRLIAFEPEGEIAVISVEDMIADRMGQYSSGTAPEMLGQAQILFALHSDLDRAYLERRMARRLPVSTVSPTSKPKSVRFEDFAADIARRREAAGNPELPRNSGKRRTPSKKALLNAIEDAGGRW